MKTVLYMIFITIQLEFSSAQLIRPNFVYQNVIKGVHDYYNNTCILLLHSTPNPIESQGVDQSQSLLNLQGYLSRAHIRTAIMEIRTFIKQVGGSYYHIKRPLFVLLNDDADVREQFANEIVPWIDMSYPNWLIFFKNETRIEDFFHGIYIQFDCTMMVTKPDNNMNNSGEVITEVYQIDREEELRQGPFGTWSQSEGMKTPEWSLYQRRGDLHGHKFRDPPQSIILRDDHGTVTGLGGFFGGLMALLQESMNCTFIYDESDEWGYLMDNGSWTGLIASLIDNTADIAAAELIMTRARIDAIKFTTPVYSTKIRTFIKRPSSSALKWGTYFAPFESRVWIAIFVMIAVTTATISIVKSLILLLHIDWRDSESVPSAVHDIFFSVFGALCGQAMDASALDPIKISHFVIHLTGVIILAAYSAALISSLAVKTFILPFTTMEGLLNDGTYRFGVVRSSADYSLFQNTTDEILSRLFEQLLSKEIDLPKNYLEGLSRVCDNEKYAFMTVDNAVSQLKSSIKCTLIPLDAVSQVSIALGLRPGSPYRGILDSNLLLLRDSGVLQRLLNTDWALPGDNVKAAWQAVELEDLLPLAVMLFGGLNLSLMCLGIEKLMKRNSKIIKRKRRIVRRFINNAKLPSNQIKLFVK